MYCKNKEHVTLFKDSAAQYVLNERDSSCNEVVGGDGVAVGAGARVDVERTTATGGRGHRGRGECRTIPVVENRDLSKIFDTCIEPALALVRLNSLAAGWDVVPER